MTNEAIMRQMVLNKEQAKIREITDYVVRLWHFLHNLKVTKTGEIMVTNSFIKTYSPYFKDKV